MNIAQPGQRRRNSCDRRGWSSTLVSNRMSVVVSVLAQVVAQNRECRNSFQFPLVKKVVGHPPSYRCHLFYCASRVSKFSTWRFLAPGCTLKKALRDSCLEKIGGPGYKNSLCRFLRTWPWAGKNPQRLQAKIRRQADGLEVVAVSLTVSSVHLAGNVGQRTPGRCIGC